MANNDALDKIDSALFSLMRIAKRPAYWEEFQRQANAQIDRPAAAILLLLSHHPLSFSNLVTKLGIEAPSISRKVHELEQAGYIRREPTDDRRVHLLSLTSSGQALYIDVVRARRAMLASDLSDWTELDKTKLSDLLTRLASDLAKRYGNTKEKREER